MGAGASPSPPTPPALLMPRAFSPDLARGDGVESRARELRERGFETKVSPTLVSPGIAAPAGKTDMANTQTKKPEAGKLRLPHLLLLATAFLAFGAIGGFWGAWQNLCFNCPSIAQISTWEPEQLPLPTRTNGMMPTIQREHSIVSWIRHRWISPALMLELSN